MPTPDTTIDIEEELERLRQAELAQPDFGPALDDLAAPAPAEPLHQPDLFNAPEGYHYEGYSDPRDRNASGSVNAVARYRLAPGPAPDPRDMVQTMEGKPAAGGPLSGAEAMAPAVTGSAGAMRAAREAEAMALFDRGKTLAGEAKRAAAPRDLSSLARTPYEPKPPSATAGFDPMAESVAPEMRPFGNTAADRKWFGRELDRIDTSTPEGAARQRELKAMEPDFSQRMTEPELSKMDAGFQAIARGGRPSGVAPAPGSPRPPPAPAGSQLAELDSRSAGWYKSPLLMNDAELASAMRHREKLAATPGLEMRQSLAALARQPKPPSIVDQARANKYNAEAERAKAQAAKYGRRGGGGGGAFGAAAGVTADAIRGEFSARDIPVPPEVDAQIERAMSITNPKVRADALKVVAGQAKVYTVQHDRLQEREAKEPQPAPEIPGVRIENREVYNSLDNTERRQARAIATAANVIRDASASLVSMREKHGMEWGSQAEADFLGQKTLLIGQLTQLAESGVLNEGEFQRYSAMIPSLTPGPTDAIPFTDVTLNRLRGARAALMKLMNSKARAYGLAVDDDGGTGGGQAPPSGGTQTVTFPDGTTADLTPDQIAKLRNNPKYQGMKVAP